ncbi:MAG: FRG domain-containing protein [Hydrogenophaga sp.]|nr:FRG domain-containing protein [Hydrogenophaga sp.]
MHLQQFGKIETEQGEAHAMLCIDQDSPLEVMIHVWGGGVKSYGCLFTAKMSSAGLQLEPSTVFYEGSDGGVYAPQVLTDEELEFSKNLKVLVSAADGFYQGHWTHKDGSPHQVKFGPLIDGVKRVQAEECSTWGDLKSWMEKARAVYGCSLFRGHGSTEYALRTTLSRAGRHRVDRYCFEELAHFAAMAEAILGTRLDLGNAVDYATCLGLAQHHGLPTPMLDWTASPYVAAFFAFSDALEKHREKIDSVKVRLYALTREFVSSSSPRIVNVPRLQPYLNFLAVSPRLNPRLQAQQGQFLVTNIGDLEGFIRHAEEHAQTRLAYAVDVPALVAFQALEDLAFMGLTAATLFPGLDGVARAIRHKMGFRSSSP